MPCPYIYSVDPCASVVPDALRLLRRENQQGIACRAGSENVAGADEEHAARDGRAGGAHRAALGRDMVYRFVITDHIVFPE